MHTNELMFLKNLGLKNTTDLNQPTIIFDLSSYGLLCVNGADAKKLLQGQLTCDVENIKNGKLCAHCNPQGRIISLFYLFQHHETYYLLLPRNMIAMTASALKKYAIFYKVSIEDVSDNFQIIGASEKTAMQLAQHDALINIAIFNGRAIFIGTTAALQSAITNLSPTPFFADKDLWKLANIQAKIPHIYPETSAVFLPHELNLDKLNAIDFEKGCYTGQEIIARMHYRGKLKNHLYQVELKDGNTPIPGSPVYSEVNEGLKAVGNIVDVCKENDDHYFLLIVTDEESIKNNRLVLEHNRLLIATSLDG